MNYEARQRYHEAKMSRIRPLLHLTVEQIAERLKCHPQTIHVALATAGIVRKPKPRLEEEDWPNIKALLDDGMYLTVIMKKYQTSFYRLKDFIERHREPDVTLEDSDWPVINALLDDGMSLSTIKAKFETDTPRLKAFIARHRDLDSRV